MKGPAKKYLPDHQPDYQCQKKMLIETMPDVNNRKLLEKKIIISILFRYVIDNFYYMSKL